MKSGKFKFSTTQTSMKWTNLTLKCGHMIMPFKKIRFLLIHIQCS